MEVAREIRQGELVEAELDSFISRRDKQRRMTEGERLEQELWQQSVERYNARRREEHRQAWAAYHEDQAARHRATLEALASYHEGEAARLRVDEPIEESA